MTLSENQGESDDDQNWNIIDVMDAPVGQTFEEIQCDYNCSSFLISENWKTEDFTKCGSGRNAQVFRVDRNAASALFRARFPDVQDLAIKLCPTSAKFSEETNRANREGRIHSALNGSDNVVTYYDHKLEVLCPNHASALFVSGRRLTEWARKFKGSTVKSHDVICFHYCLMEYCSKTLDQDIKCKPYRVEKIMGTAFQILTGIHMIHKKGLMHRDIKPSNILIDSYNVVKLSDFGEGARDSKIDADESVDITISQSGHQRQAGTDLYRAPEVAHGSYGSKADIFSAGLTILEMLLRQDESVDFREVLLNISHPYGERKEEVVENSHIFFLIEIQKLQLPSDFVELLLRMINRDPEKRVVAETALETLKRINMRKDTRDVHYFSISEDHAAAEEPQEKGGFHAMQQSLLRPKRRPIPPGHRWTLNTYLQLYLSLNPREEEIKAHSPFESAVQQLVNDKSLLSLVSITKEKDKAVYYYDFGDKDSSNVLRLKKYGQTIEIGIRGKSEWYLVDFLRWMFCERTLTPSEVRDIIGNQFEQNSNRRLAKKPSSEEDYIEPQIDTRHNGKGVKLKLWTSIGPSKEISILPNIYLCNVESSYSKLCEETHHIVSSCPFLFEESKTDIEKKISITPNDDNEWIPSIPPKAVFSSLIPGENAKSLHGVMKQLNQSKFLRGSSGKFLKPFDLMVNQF